MFDWNAFTLQLGNSFLKFYILRIPEIYRKILTHAVLRSIQLQLKCSWIFKPFGKCTTVGTRKTVSLTRDVITLHFIPILFDYLKLPSNICCIFYLETKIFLWLDTYFLFGIMIWFHVRSHISFFKNASNELFAIENNPSSGKLVVD